MLFTESICGIADIFRAGVAGIQTGYTSTEINGYTDVINLVAGLCGGITRRCSRQAEARPVASLRSITEQTVVT